MEGYSPVATLVHPGRPAPAPVLRAVPYSRDELNPARRNPGRSETFTTRVELITEVFPMRGTRSLGLALIAATLGAAPALAQQSTSAPPSNAPAANTSPANTSRRTRRPRTPRLPPTCRRRPTRDRIRRRRARTPIRRPIRRTSQPPPTRPRVLVRPLRPPAAPRRAPRRAAPRRPTPAPAGRPDRCRNTTIRGAPASWSERPSITARATASEPSTTC